jgi:hypothetical protein
MISAAVFTEELSWAKGSDLHPDLGSAGRFLPAAKAPRSGRASGAEKRERYDVVPMGM